MSSDVRGQLVLDARADSGESPWWSPRERKLYWVDIHGRALHRFDPVTGADEQWSMPDVVTFVATHVRGGLVLALHDRIVYAAAPGAPLRTLITLAVPRGGRLNDGAIDPLGRLWIGAMGPPDAPCGTAALYCIDLDRKWRAVMSGFRTVNGLAFAHDGTAMYVSDSHPLVRNVWRTDYDAQSGHVGERMLFIETRDLPGRPDGGCVDDEGAYWMSAVDGGAILRFDPGGRLLGRVLVDTPKPSKAVFGGEALDTMFITSLRRGATADAHAGGLFAAHTSAKGVPPRDCAVALPHEIA